MSEHHHPPHHLEGKETGKQLSIVCLHVHQNVNERKNDKEK